MITEPVRINKYIASSGICSRREADALILAGKVLVNGTIPNAGDKVSDNDQITIDGKLINPEKNIDTVLLAYNKPVGIVCSTVNQGDNHNNIIEAINYPVRIFPIGRLDKDSEGLILLTNDGALSDKLMRSANHYEKEYEVTVDKAIDDNFITSMSNGVDILLKNDIPYKTRKCKVSKIDTHTFRIILTEGKNRQIRRMCDALGYNVKTLKRVRIINILLDNIKSGNYKEIDIDSLKL